jgi:hypothetical protein
MSYAYRYLPVTRFLYEHLIVYVFQVHVCLAETFLFILIRRV